MSQLRVDKIKDALRGSAEQIKSISELLKAGKSILDMERLIWDAYSKAEYAIFFAKLEVGEVNPSTHRRSDTDDRGVTERMDEASATIDSSFELFVAGRTLEALLQARSARNLLRGILVDVRKMRKKALLEATPP